MKSSGNLAATRASFARLSALGVGDLGIFANRARQLQLLATGEQVIRRNQEASSHFADIVSDLSANVGTQLAAQIGALRFEMRWNTILLAALAGLSLLLAVLVGWLYVARRIAARLTQLSESMAQIAAGRFDAPIPAGGSDEITVMAEALRYFRDRTAAQREIEHSMVEVAEAANKAKSAFLANMSHELRTPLNSIIGFSEVLQERMFGEMNEKQAEYINDIHGSGTHLLSLINDILDLSKIEAGRMELDLARFDLPSAIDNALTLIRERALRHGIELTCDIDAALGDIVADERKFKQILLNLLSNAVKFTPEGGRITVAARIVGNTAEVSVTDTGIGIAPADQTLVFEEFRQANSELSRKVEGTGLGLALTRKFVELHGGKIRLASEPGKGSTFTFSLPLEPATAAQTAPAQALHERSNAYQPR